MNYFDLHCDTVSKCFDEYGGDCRVDCEKPCEFENYTQCFALFVSDEYKGKSAFERAMKFCDLYEKNRSLFQSKKIKPLLTLENCEIFAENAENINYWKLRGAVMGTLTWNGENSLGFGCACSGGGLKEFGKWAVSQMENCGIIVDVSHLNEDGFRDVCKLAKRPFVASHSNCYSLCFHKRNLKDYQIREIIARGGLIGICFYPLFLGKGEVFEKVYEHISHIISLGGEKTIAFGSDFDGAKMDKTLDSVQKVGCLYSFLEGKGFDRTLLEDIFYNNAQKFFDSVL